MRKGDLINIILFVGVALLLVGIVPYPGFIPVWVIWMLFFITLAIALNTLFGKPIPFLRWSFRRMILGMKTLLDKWQVGDGREQKVAEAVLKKAKRNDAADVIRVIDNFGYNDSLLINVGDKKGKIVDSAIQRANPKIILELGTYVGYSAIRMAQQLPPDGHLY